jgi:iron complex outermembrane receptor protein
MTLMPLRLTAAPLVALLALLSVTALATPERAYAQERRHLHGVLEDSTTGRPLSGAEVTVEWTSLKRMRTDAEGRFDFRDLPAGTVRLRVRLLGYAPLDRSVNLSADDVLLKLYLTPATVLLQQVAVTADTLTDALQRVTATSTLDADALAMTRGQTLGETIKNLPGVSVIQLGPSIAKPVIRGLNSQRVLVLNAGLRQEDQQWGTEHAPNIDTFDADAVTVVRGAATVLYGPDALGGVVRIDHAAVPDAAPLRGDLALNGFSNSRQGALSIGVQGGGLTLPGIGRTGYRVRLSGRVAGNGAAPDYYLANTGFNELNGSATLGVQRRWGTSELFVARFGTELGVLKQAHAGNFDDLRRAMTSPPTDSAFSYAIDRPSQRVAHNTVRWRTTVALPDAHELEFVYGFQFNHRREYDNHGPLRFRNVPAFHLKLYTNSLDVRWKHAPWHGMLGTVGVSATQQGNQTLGKAFLIPGFDLGQGAVYAQEEWHYQRLSLTGGVRLDRIAQSTLPYADAGIRSPAGTKAWNGLSGSLGAAYRLTDRWNVSLRVAQAWRPPTVNERYAQGVHHGTAQYELGAPALGAEQSRGVEATMQYAGRRFTVDAAAYSNRIDQFIYLRPREPVFTIRGAFPAFLYAQTDARIRGVEIAAAWQPLSWLSVNTTATAVRGTNRLTDEPLFDMPADRALVQLRIEPETSRRGRWFAALGTVLVREQDGVPNGTVYTLPTAGYALLNGEVGVMALPVIGRRLDVSLSVNNALDARYRDYLSRYRLFVNDPGRDVVLRVRTPLW